MAFARGARPTPAHKLFSLSPYRVTQAPLPQFGVVPPRLDVWGNDTYGDCVSAEEAFAKTWWSVYCGLPETFPTASEVIAFARKYGYLNGADLTEVMDTMIRSGMSISGKVYNDGHYFSVSFGDEMVLQSAIDPSDGTGGPVKIAIDADALPPGAGNQQGWYSTSGARYTNTDHCVAISAYGRADFVYDQLKVSLPSGLSPSTPGYGLFTWGTIGFVTHDWLMGTCTEAYARNPTTPGQSPVVPPVPPSPPVPPPPGPPVPPPPPVPVVGGYATVSPTTVTTKPHSFSFDVGGIGHRTVKLEIPADVLTVPGQSAPVTLGGFHAPAPIVAGDGFGGVGAIPWATIIPLLLKYGPKIYAIIAADRAAGKSWEQVIADIIAAFGS